MSLLLAGGADDPNLAALAAGATALGVGVQDLRAAPDRIPVVSFDPRTRILTRDGQPCTARAAFLRPDVFAPGATAVHKASVAALLGVLRGWIAAVPEIAVFNRDPFGRSRSVNKGAALAAAARLGLAIPETRLGNDRAALLALASGANLIQKPVTGGDLCRPLGSDALAKARRIPPIIAQSRVDGPDLRVFRAGAAFVAFELRSDSLDYREDRRPEIVPVTAPPDVLPPLRALTDEMGLTWSATDFKLCPRRGPVYLETNANPMFAAFDRAAGGALCRAMFLALGLGEGA